MLYVSVDSPNKFRIAMFLLLAMSWCLISTGNSAAQTKQKQLSKSQIEREWRRANWKFDRTWEVVSKEADVEAWGKAAEQAFAGEDLKQVMKLVEFSPLHDRCVDGVTHEEFKSGFMVGINQGTTNLMKQLMESGSYVFRGVRQTDFGPCALMRMLDPAGGCNYHLWRVQQDANDRVVGVDMYIFLSGESFGDTMRRITLLSVPKDDRSFYQKLTGKEQAMAAHQVEMMKMLQATQNQDFPTVLTTYDKLPGKLQNEKSFLIMRMTAALQIGEDEYIAALEDYQKNYPNDASAALMGLDLYFLKKQYDKMYTALDQLEAAVGKDGHLTMLRAIGFNQEGKLDEARETIEVAVATEPQLETPHWTLIEIALAQKDFGRVTAALKQIVQQFGYTEFALAGNEMYADYVNSDEHTEFQEYLKTVVK